MKPTKGRPGKSIISILEECSARTVGCATNPFKVDVNPANIVKLEQSNKVYSSINSIIILLIGRLELYHLFSAAASIIDLFL